MYIHIGQDVSLLAHWLVAVLDMDRATGESQDLRDFLLQAEKRGNLQWLGPEIPRSIVVTLDRVYLSPVSAETLKQRFSRKYYKEKLGRLTCDALSRNNQVDDSV